MSKDDKDETVTEDATVEQVNAAEPVHPDPIPGTEHDPAEAGSTAELREQIEETRSELGDTVEALTYKLDVKSRAKDSIDERKQQAKDGVQHAKETISETAAKAQAKVSDVASTAQAKASGAAATAQDRATDAAATAQERASDAAATAQAKVPGDAADARATAEHAGQKVDENRVPVAAIAAVAGVLVVVIVWRRRSR